MYRFLLLFLLTVSLSAQQDTNNSFYRYNMNLINPAFAGANNETNVAVNIRSQWSGIEGAPETQSFIFDKPVGSNVGLGLSIINDKTFIENQTFIAVDFSYRLKISESSDLYFGLKGGFNSYDANTDGLLTYGLQQDPSLMNISGQFNPNIGAGLYLRHENYFISLSIPKILTPDRLEQNDDLVRLGMDKSHMYLSGGFNILLSENLILKPTTLLRYVASAPFSVDLTTLLEINNAFEIGGSYRLDESFAVLSVFQIQNWIEIGYAYEMPINQDIKGFEKGSHEIMFNLKL